MINIKKNIKLINKFIAFGISNVMITMSFCGCVDQHPAQSETESGSSNINANTSSSAKIVATSVATAEITDKLGIDLVGVCDSNISKLPERYDDVERVGLAMSPDTEKIASLNPDWILSPKSLENDLEPKYEAIGSKSIFLNLESVDGMYQSISDLGEIFGKEKEAKKLVDDYNDYMDDFNKKNEGKEHPKVLVLMGFPGSYSVATDNSYTGSLVKMAGGENVYAGESGNYIVANTEDILKKDPDIIICTAHGGLDEEAYKYLKDDFKTNEVWQHFKAVKEDKVYYLDSKLFGMSATFDYPKALDKLESVFYGDGDIDENTESESTEAES